MTAWMDPNPTQDENNNQLYDGHSAARNRTRYTLQKRLRGSQCHFAMFELTAKKLTKRRLLFYGTALAASLIPALLSAFLICRCEPPITLPAAGQRSVSRNSSPMILAIRSTISMRCCCRLGHQHA